MLAWVPDPNRPVGNTTKSGFATLPQRIVLMLKEYLAGKLPAPTDPPLPRLLDQSCCTPAGVGSGRRGEKGENGENTMSLIWVDVRAPAGRERTMRSRYHCCQYLGSAAILAACSSLAG